MQLHVLILYSAKVPRTVQRVVIWRNSFIFIVGCPENCFNQIRLCDKERLTMLLKFTLSAIPTRMFININSSLHNVIRNLVLIYLPILQHNGYIIFFCLLVLCYTK